MADTDRGIPRIVRHRLFQPFVTSEGSSGNGLGLWVARGIVHRHNGRVLVRTCSEPGRSGTIFAVLLPAGERERSREHAAVLETRRPSCRLILRAQRSPMLAGYASAPRENAQPRLRRFAGKISPDRCIVYL